MEASPRGAAHRRDRCGRAGLRAGGGYTLQLTPSSSLSYDIQRSTGAVIFNGIDVTMPLGDPAAAGTSVRAKHRKRKHHR